MLSSRAGTVVSPGCTAMRALPSAQGAARAAAATISELLTRPGVRLAQVMTGLRATNAPGGRLPDLEMIFGQRETSLPERFEAVGRIEPGRGDEARDTPADGVLDDLAPLGEPPQRFDLGKLGEFACAGPSYASA